MKILVVDDEKKIADTIAQRLELRGIETAPVYDGLSALERVRDNCFNGIILDLRLPDIDGTEVLERVMKEHPHMRVVILSGHANEGDFRICMELGAVACFRKPADIEMLLQALSG